MKTSTAFKKWKARIENLSCPWTENDIIYFRKAVGHNGLQDPAERALLISLFNTMISDTDGVFITEQHSRKGQIYLLENSLKKNGDPRKQNIFGEYELHILKNLSHHLFVGLYRNGLFCDHYFPIYRAVDKDGNYMDYVGATYSQCVVLHTVISDRSRLNNIPNLRKA